jgi:hypothetical protein
MAILCRIKEAIGRTDVCPKRACPFWEIAGRGPGHCVFDHLDLAGRRDLAALLAGLRDQLEQVAGTG